MYVEVNSHPWKDLNAVGNIDTKQQFQVIVAWEAINLIGFEIHFPFSYVRTITDRP